MSLCRPTFSDIGRAIAGLILCAMAGGCSGPRLDPITQSEVQEHAKRTSALVYPPGPAEARFVHEATILGSADVVAETRADRFEQFATGAGRKVEGFGKPFGIVAHHGRLYVSDTLRRLVHVLDRAKGEYRQIGTAEPGRLAKPLGLAVDGQGRIYVCDGTSRRVEVYEADGTHLNSVGGPDLFKRPSSVAVTPDGTRMFVLDTGGIDSTQHRIVVLDAKTRNMSVIGKRGATPGQFNLPLAVKRAPQGQLFVVDAGNFRVQKLGPDGAPLSSFGKPGRYPGQFGHPKDLALDADGNIYVTDSFFGVFQIFNSSGRILLSIGERNEQGGPGRFLLPAGIDVDVDGRVYVVDQYFRKVEVFRPAALPAATPPGGQVAALRPKPASYQTR